MDTALWVVQGLLAVVFTLTALLKLSQPKEKLAEKMAWAQEYEPAQIKGIGAAELAGAVGLILPMKLDILPWLTPVAAAGLATVMMLAVPVHQRLQETSNIVGNFVLMGLAFFVCVGRVFSMIAA